MDIVNGFIFLNSVYFYNDRVSTFCQLNRTLIAKNDIDTSPCLETFKKPSEMCTCISSNEVREIAKSGGLL